MSDQSLSQPTNTADANVTTEPISPEMEYMNMMWLTWNATSKHTQVALREVCGLDHREFTTLRFLQTQVWTPAALAAELSIPRYEMSRVLATLEERHCITRHPTPTDRRSVQIRITEEGRKLWREGVTAVQKAIRPRVEGLEDEINAISGNLKKVLTVMQ